MAKIALFADGTGNARTGRFPTNVWKLYSALDTSPDSGQIAYYHDGVGTSSVAPLRYLGGIFGYGLARNIKALYAFLCRNYRSDADEIFLFGFSRGAFTARILGGLIANEGVRHITDEALLAEWVAEAYARNRHRISLAQVDPVRAGLFRLAARVTGADRPRRDWSAFQLRQPDIALVGVWDTVAAYGGPIIEMVRGFDRWIWPLSMPDYRLHPKVLAGRHALSLDEAREAFLPLPWDEVGSQHPERIRQVWFAGVHSDVGGGYPDQGLSSVPLCWMLAQAKAAGLAFVPEAEMAIGAAANAWAPIHDSRTGIAAAYRYQPRSINALMGLTPDSPLRDPASGNQPLLARVLVHPSVLTRVEMPDGYAPIVLPPLFDVDIDESTRLELPGGRRDLIWRSVAARRWMQRLLLVTIALMLFSPLYWRPRLVRFVDQGLAAPLGGLLGLVPVLPAWLKTAYAGHGCWLVCFALLIWGWLALGDRQRMKIEARAAQMWAGCGPATSPGEPLATALPPDRSLLSPLSLRRELERRLRWQVLPGLFGLSYYFAAVFLLVAAVVQLSLALSDVSGGLCSETTVASPTFAIGEVCHRLGIRVQSGNHYRIRIAVLRPWMDGGLPAGPRGFTYVDSVSSHLSRQPQRDFGGSAYDGMSYLLGIMLRREISGHWFQPVLAIRQPKDSWSYKVILTTHAGDGGAYYAHFRAPASGTTWIYVNDAVLPWNPGYFYSNNTGSASVEIKPED